MIVKTNQKRSRKPSRCLNEAYNFFDSSAILNEIRKMVEHLKGENVEIIQDVWHDNNSKETFDLPYMIIRNTSEGRNYGIALYCIDDKIYDRDADNFTELLGEADDFETIGVFINTLVQDEYGRRMEGYGINDVQSLKRQVKLAVESYGDHHGTNRDMLIVMKNLKADLNPKYNWVVDYASVDSIEFAFTDYNDYKECKEWFDEYYKQVYNSKVLYGADGTNPKYAYCVIVMGNGIKDAFENAFGFSAVPVDNLVKALKKGE